MSVSLKKKLLLIGFPVVIVALILIYQVYSSHSKDYFYPVTKVVAHQQQYLDKPIRVGGRIFEGSIAWDRNQQVLRFELVENQQHLKIYYPKMPPDGFKYGVDVIAEGKLTHQGVFQATKLMIGCPNKYEA